MSRNATVQIILRARDLTGAALTGAKTKVTALKNALTGMKAAMVGFMASIAATAFLGYLVRVNAEYGKLLTQLRTFEGSAAGAKAVFAQLSVMAAKTPFEIGNIVKAFITLRSAGIKPTEESMMLFGDHAAAFGADINDVAEAIRAATTGEMERLKQLGVVARIEGNQIAATFGGVTTRIGRDAQSIVTYMENLSRQNFAGGMERQSKTLDGAISNLKDAFSTLARAIGDAGLTELFIEMAQGATGLTEGLTENAGGLRKWLFWLRDTAKMGGIALDQLSARFDGVGARWEYMKLKLFGTGITNPEEHKREVARITGAKADSDARTARADAARARTRQERETNFALNAQGTPDQRLRRQLELQMEQGRELSAAQLREYERIVGAGDGMAKTGGATASTNAGGKEKKEKTVAEALSDQVDLEAARLKLRDNAIARAESLLALEQKINAELAKEMDPARRATLLTARANAREAREEAGLSAANGGLPKLTIADSMGGGYRPGRAVARVDAGLATPASTIAGDGITKTQQFGLAIREAFREGERLDTLIANMTTNTMQGFGSAIEDAFAALVDGSKTAGQAFAGAMLGAVSQVASGMGQFALGKAALAMGEGLMGDPRGFAAAARYAGAATIFFGLAGALRGAGNRAGGGGAGRADARRDRNALEGARGEATLVIEGGILDMNQPHQERAMARALSQLSGRRVKVKTRGR